MESLPKIHSLSDKLIGAPRPVKIPDRCLEQLLKQSCLFPISHLFAHQRYRPQLHSSTDKADCHTASWHIRLMPASPAPSFHLKLPDTHPALWYWTTSFHPSLSNNGFPGPAPTETLHRFRPHSDNGNRLLASPIRQKRKMLPQNIGTPIRYTSSCIFASLYPSSHFQLIKWMVPMSRAS